MRMRKKKNIDKRIEQCSDVLATNPSSIKGKWKDFFENDNPIYLEIGCGKGRFILTHASNNPNINYIGIELEPSALIIATEKAQTMDLDNLIFINYDANKLNDIFLDDEISRLYLNFSDPWPARKYEKRRLTHTHFLEIYDKILCKNAQIHFKTDNQHLFEFSLEQFTRNSWYLQNLSLDLHKTNRVNVMTEYEEKFSNLGFRINRVEAVRIEDKPIYQEVTEEIEEENKKISAN